VFVGVAAFYGVLAAIDPDPSDCQVSLATAALKAADPSLFPADPLFGRPASVLSISPVFVDNLRLLWPKVGGDPLLPLRLLVGPLVLLYGLSMYALLYRQCQSWSIAAFVAVLSTVVIEALGGSAWGIGTLASGSPAGLTMALTPLIVLALLDTVDQSAPVWRLLVIFLLVGLLGRFDSDWTINMALVLAGVYVARQRFTPIAYLTAAACLVLAVAVALPQISLGVNARLIASSGAESARSIGRLLREGDGALLYPQAMRALPEWLLWAVPLAIPTLVVLSQVDRFRVPFVGFWVAFAVSAATVALVFQTASQLVGLATGMIPPLIGFVQASCFLMLPLYALFAQALTSLFRLTRGHYGLMRAACTVAAVAWLLPSANLGPARRATYDAASVLLSEENKPRRLRKLLETASRDAELQAIARWAESHTPPDAVFLTDRSDFRLLSHRAIVAGEGDGCALRFGNLSLLADWQQRLAHQNQLLHPVSGKADPAAISQFVGELSSREPFTNTNGNGSAWYILLSVSAAPEGSSILTEQTSGDWGKFYKVYCIK
jgi:hypothetical protein